MAQTEFIKDIAKYGLVNDQEKLLIALNELIDHYKKTKKVNFALQLQSILKDSIRLNHKNESVFRVSTGKQILAENDPDVTDFILEKLTSDYHFDDIICSEDVKQELKYFIEEHKRIEVFQQLELPIANKVLFYGPSGCGKTLASYVLAGELEKMMMVVNLGAIVSSKLGETSKNLSKVFRRAASEECIVLIDEFDSLGKIRDYSQDHGEMKRVVNTILQLFDYLPSTSVVIAATNQIEMIDDALLRRFDLKLNLQLPEKGHIKALIKKVLGSNFLQLDDPKSLTTIINSCQGLSYYLIQKSLVTAIKRSLINQDKMQLGKAIIDTKLWIDLIKKEKTS